VGVLCPTFYCHFHCIQDSNRETSNIPVDIDGKHFSEDKSSNVNLRLKKKSSVCVTNGF